MGISQQILCKIISFDFPAYFIENGISLVITLSNLELSLIS